jgi:uncharacterized membrane protein YdfJ with MMPL/SSD domain
MSKELDVTALSSWCFRHRAVVAVGWLLMIVFLAVLGRSAAYSNTFTVPGTDSTTALNLLTKAAPAHAGDQDSIVWHVESGTVQSPAVRERITAMLDQVATAPAVASVASPYTPADAAQISKDSMIAYATVTFDAQASNLSKQDITRVMNLAEAAREPGLDVELGGQAIGNAEQPSLGLSAGVGILAAAIALFLAFGSMLAMLLPLAVAIFGLVSGLMTASLLSHGVSIPSLGPTLATLIALGVGMDYALFIVTREPSWSPATIRLGVFISAKSGFMNEKYSAANGVRSAPPLPGRQRSTAALTRGSAMLMRRIPSSSGRDGPYCATIWHDGDSEQCSVSLYGALLRLSIERRGAPDDDGRHAAARQRWPT